MWEWAGSDQRWLSLTSNAAGLGGLVEELPGQCWFAVPWESSHKVGAKGQGEPQIQRGNNRGSVLERKINARDATHHHLNGRDTESACVPPPPALRCSSGRGCMYPAQLQRWPNRTELMMISEASGNRLAAVTHAAAVTRAVGALVGIAGLLHGEAQGG